MTTGIMAGLSDRSLPRIIPAMSTPPSPQDPSFPATAIRLLMDLHPLDRVPRAGFLLRGVAEPESVAAHSHALATALRPDVQSPR